MHTVGTVSTWLVDSNIGMYGTVFDQQMINLLGNAHPKGIGDFGSVERNVVSRRRTENEISGVGVVIAFDEYPFVSLL